MFHWGHRRVRKILRSIIALALLFEAAAFFIGATLHLGVSLPLPYAEVESMRFALLETVCGVVLLAAFGATVLRKRNAWKIAVVANVVGVAIVAYMTTGGVPGTQSSHHRPMLILLIAVLVGLSIPRCRQALENGRHARRRRRILQAF
jgi:nicotinamide riboside transporter PnuC